MNRDLARPDVWEQSLERSRARRAERARPRSVGGPSSGRPTPARARDLTDTELWELSRSRSRRRHEAEERSFDPPARRASLAALLVAAGGAATAVASGVPEGGSDEAAARPADPPAPEPGAHEPDARPEPRRVATAPPVAAAPGRGAAIRPARANPSRPSGVRELQQALGIAADGDFGAGTRRALVRWQRAHGLPADGVAGPQTREELGIGDGPVLRSAVAPRAARHARASAPRAVAARAGGGVSELQRALGLPVDGVFGPATERALEAWQRKHGLAADGVAGPQTRARLGLGSGPVLKRRRSSHRGGGSRAGNRSSTVGRVIAAANAIATKPYKYGGGHGSFQDSGYDCSGSVSYALHGGGLLSAPLDSGGFMSYGAPGPGRHITIYAHPGHVFMTIDGRRFDTSARWETGSRWTSTARSSSGYVVRHPPGL